MARRSAKQDLKGDVREEVQLGTQPARPRDLVQHGVRTDGHVQMLHILDPIDFLSINCTIVCMTNHDLHEGSEV